MCGDIHVQEVALQLELTKVQVEACKRTRDQLDEELSRLDAEKVAYPFSLLVSSVLQAFSFFLSLSRTLSNSLSFTDLRHHSFSSAFTHAHTHLYLYI
jgi:hypothetical protein